MSQIELIGISGDRLDEQQAELVAGCRAVVVSKRHGPLVRDLPLPIIGITPIQEMVQEVEHHLETGSVAVLASGDPLFFGIGKTLLNHFSAEQIQVHPALSALQLACARFKTPWDNIALLSLHGRDGDNLAGKILTHEKAVLFTDSINTPDHIARTLLQILETNGDGERAQKIRMKVAEDLALESEKITQGSLVEISRMTFSPLNMVLIEQELPPAPLGRFGLHEKEISHSRGLITKDEVRAVSLHKLRLPEQGVLWDIGGGSGSVSLEAARLNPGLQVFTIERKEEEQDNIRRNIKKFNAYNITLICGEAPEALEELPPPDRVFIGGSGKNLKEIIAYAAAKLPHKGRLVANAVLAKTAELAPVVMQENNLQVQTATISVTRRESTQEEPLHFNPITIITGVK